MVTPAKQSTGRGYGRAVSGGLLGLGVVFLCVLPPILHFVTGPLGPLLGGIVGGSRARTSGLAAGIVGLVMGVGLIGLAAVFGGIVLAVTASLPEGSMPSFVDPATLVPAAIGAFVYTIVLGSIGALVGGRLRAKS